MKVNLGEIQQYLEKEKLDGWLLYDFRGMNTIAAEVGPFNGLVSRRWFLLIPKTGKPVLLSHKIEESAIVGDWMERRFYNDRKMLATGLQDLLKNVKTVAMEYSPNNDIPYVSLVDAGTMETVRACGVDVVSSANLVQHFQARWDEQGLATHKVAANFLTVIVQDVFNEVGEKVSKGIKVDEYEVQQRILHSFENLGMVWEHEPIVAVSANAAQPHYAPTAEIFSPIKEGDLLLLDIFCRQKGDTTISADITWTAYVGKPPIPPKMLEVFKIVTAARDAGVGFINYRLDEGKQVYGWEVDDKVRNVITEAGYGEYFTHRTGHSLGTAIHGNGVNIDNFETKDKRLLEPGVGFTIEPGIYLPGEFGIRSEIDCHIGENGLEVTTLPMQTELKALLQ